MKKTSLNKPLEVVLDSNILISAYVFGGKPELVLNLIISKEIEAITSNILIAEFIDVLRKKFKVTEPDILEIQNEIEDLFEIVYPTKEIDIVKDTDDNRVLEVAVEGECDYIITGDKDLLILKTYKDIKILTADEFLEIISSR